MALDTMLIGQRTFWNHETCLLTIATAHLLLQLPQKAFLNQKKDQHSDQLKILGANALAEIGGEYSSIEKRL